MCDQMTMYDDSHSPIESEHYSVSKLLARFSDYFAT